MNRDEQLKELFKKHWEKSEEEKKKELIELGVIQEEKKKVYITVQGNYALSSKIQAFSTKELAEGFRNHYYKESKNASTGMGMNVFELEIDSAVLKEEDL